jgi:hypothetical protein
MKNSKRFFEISPKGQKRLLKGHQTDNPYADSLLRDALVACSRFVHQLKHPETLNGSPGAHCVGNDPKGSSIGAWVGLDIDMAGEKAAAALASFGIREPFLEHFVVTVTVKIAKGFTFAEAELDSRDDLGAHDYQVKARNSAEASEQALDAFHEEVAIGVLEAVTIATKVRVC